MPKSGNFSPAFLGSLSPAATKEGIEELERNKSFFENAKKHASASLHKLIKKLKNWKKEVEEKDRALDKALLEASKLAQRAQNLNDTTAPNYRDFANDIQFDEARKMAAKRDGKGLCRWFENLEMKFGSWLHRAQYFAKRFWNKTPDELVVIAEDMRQSYCSNLGDVVAGVKLPKNAGEKFPLLGI